MEQNRQFRFLIPPFVLLTSLFWGAIVNSPRDFFTGLQRITSSAGVGIIIGTVATGGVVIIAVGFLISAISILCLRILFWFRHQDYEAHVSSDSLEHIGNALGFKTKLDKHQMLYAVATFDHEILPPKLHEWVQRRWNIFVLSSNCCVALILSHLVGIVLGIGQWPWLITSTFLFVSLSINAIKAWQQTMEMLSFLSSCSLINRKGESNDA